MSEENADQAFADYVNRVFDMDVVSAAPETVTGSSTFSVPSSNALRRTVLSPAEQVLYDAVHSAAVEIANGRRSSSIISVPISSIANPVENGSSFSPTKIIYALLADYPYEMYWYDKTSATVAEPQGNNYVIRMPVMSRYAVSRGAGTYTADTNVTGAAQSAVQNARSIAQNGYGMSLLNALDYYRGQICDLVSFDAASNANDAAYGDPWQIIYVFDGDSSTNVVCEGYSKSFQYLCNLYKEANPSANFDCYSVDGALSGGVSGNHMWNIVRMDNGQNYAVDLTNSDATVPNTPNDGRRFFLVGGGNTAFARMNGTRRTYGYTLNGRDGTTLTYRYVTHNGGSNLYISLDIYSDAELNVAAGSYPLDGLNSNAVSAGASSAANTTAADGNSSAGSSSGSRFSDVTVGSAFYDAINWAVQNGITSGTGDGSTFRPNAPCTRGQMVQFLYNYRQKPAVSGDVRFSDVASNAFYRDAVLWAVQNGITSGTGDGSAFSPNASCTRGQMAMFLYRMSGSPAVSGSLSFSDVTDNSAYHDAILWAVQNGITAGTGDGSTFSPNTPCTRGQMAMFLYRMASRQ